MGIMQAHNGAEDPHVLLPDNPFVPPKGDICFVNTLPPELLSRVFEIGAMDNDDEDEDDMAYNWDNFCRDIDANDTIDGEMTKGVEEEDSDDEGDDDDDDDDEGTDDEGDSEATGSTDSSDAWPPFQILVSHVCRHWRSVALSTPSLWTTISVGSDTRPPYEHVSTLLERSKGLPIDICVDFDPPESDHVRDHSTRLPSDADLELLYSLLISHIPRWRTIEISVSEYKLMYAFLTAAADPSISAAPQLTSLELYHHDDMEDFDNFAYLNMSKNLVLFGGSAPCLTNIILWGVHVDWSQPWIASASRLIYLELSYIPENVRPSWVQFSTILRGAPKLENLVLRMSAPAGNPPEWIIEPTPQSPPDLNSPIPLLNVINLVLAFQTQTCAIGILRKLYLPAIKHLLLDFDGGDYTDLVHELAGPATFIPSTPTSEQSRSLLSRLDCLKIAGLPCQIECVETLYAELQNLTSLNLSLSYLDQLFLDTLCNPCSLAGHGDTWLPRLTTLFVSGTSGDAIREVVRKRKVAGVPLDALYIEESCDMDDEDAEWLEKNVEKLEFFEGSDDEDVIDFEDLHEDVDDGWSDIE